MSLRPRSIALFVFLLLLAAAPLRAQHVQGDRLLHDLAVLAADSMEGRRVGTPGGARARAYLLEAFREVGARPFGEGFEHPFSYSRGGGETVEGVNLVGYVEGTEAPDEFIVMTAHYDHVGVRDGAIYNGADDNASGTAALLEAVRHFRAHPPAHSILFAALDAEEEGLRGARAFLADPPVEASALRLNVNMDMVSRSEKGELYAAGTHHYPFLKPLLEPVAERSRIRLLFGHDEPGTGADDWTNASDHGPFHQAGIPFVYFGVEDHAGYHRPEDDVADITPAFFVAAVETILDAVRTLDANLE